jgi:hypothetical protein
MRGGNKNLRAVVALLAGISLALAPCTWPMPASAQTAPSCPPGYYYASDGYCYPSQPPTYAYPPPAYDVAPPVYQPPPVVDGVAIGVGLGLLFGALAGGRPGHAEHGRAVRGEHGRR